MEDKRQRARVQGAWAGPAKSQATAQPATTVKSHLQQRPGQTWKNKDQHLSDRQFVFKEPQQVTRRAPEPRVIDREGVYEISLSPTGVSRLRLYPGFLDLKEADGILEQLLQDVPWKQRTGIREDITYQQPRLTAWYGELPYTYSRITMEPNPHVTRRAPEPRVIDREGVYEISLSPTGVSRLRLYPGFLDLKEADGILEQLLQDVPWKQRTGIREDITYQQPRLTAWYGELPYTYSRITMEPNPHWHPVLSILKRRIEENTGRTFNSLLCNLYRNEKDSVDWHSDDEPSLGKCPIIASLSFGATRVFEMRKKPPPEENGDYTYVERVKIPLDHGTLLIMEGATQADWQRVIYMFPFSIECPKSTTLENQELT
ncbi:alpha-ketoglutarate-dependent dioxygenase alkB homolog 3 isoform X2 [Choloepus didactylus]|uniref:alpha-ketoglutarate-dependent dioxygenase alkB homolog 3 isoform X2 n=1 Tax=Choloepus didactylus TaxID=27675 RepID=UPI00189C84B7|nr:alpha-ketoglutarate-dependent dioxygenase alkB homolog 3 isoform X2 [Choloepus didactylus]